MMTISTLPSMHDWVLEEVHYEWASGTVSIHFKGVHKQVIALDVLNCQIPRHNPWGPSVSVNAVELVPTANAHALRIEMQSGDVIIIEAVDVHMQ